MVIASAIIDPYSAGAGLQLYCSVCIIKHTPCDRNLNLKRATPFGQLNQTRLPYNGHKKLPKHPEIG